MDLTSVCNPVIKSSNKDQKCKSLDKLKMKNMDTPTNISSFTKDITYQSTPLQPRAKRALSYDKVNAFSNTIEQTETSADEEQSATVVANSSHITHSKTLHENDFMQQAFDKSCEDGRKSTVLSHSKHLMSNKCNSSQSITPTLNHEKHKKMLGNVIKKLSPVSPGNINHSSDKIQAKKICLACSCLSMEQKNSIINLATSMGWNFTEKFSKDLSHLIVKVDQDNASSRFVVFYFFFKFEVVSSMGLALYNLNL